MLTLLRIPFLLTLMISALAARPIKPEEIIIVEITAEDVGLKVKSAEEYDTNRSHRDSFRRVSADFLTLAQKKAKFILVDMWYPDLLDMPSDESIMTALRISSNITIAAGGPFKKKYEKTHQKIAATISEMGHILLNAEDAFSFVFYPSLCAENNDWPTTKHPCPEKFLQKHIALIAAEKYLGVELSFKRGSYFEIPRIFFKKFQRITYSDFKRTPKIIEGKLVILINKPLPSMDMFDIPNQEKLSGSEILAMMVILYSKYFPEK